MSTEQELIKRAQNRDALAFGQLYDAHYQPIFSFVYSRCGNAELAKDLTSETFFQALKNLHKYKPRKGVRFKSWLFAIAVAQVGNFYRARSKMLEVTTEEAPELIAREDFRPDIAYRMGEDADQLQEQISLLRHLMGKLNQKQQTILTLRFFSKMTVPEISATMNIKQGTIKSHIHRALKKMQKLLDTYQDNSSEEKTTTTIHYVSRPSQT